MRLAVCEWSLPIKGPAVFKKLRSLGLEGIQVDDWDGGAMGNPMTNPYVQSLYRDASEKMGVSLVGMGGNALGREGGIIHPPESPEGKSCWSTLQAGLEACSGLGVPIYLAPAFFAGTIRVQAHIKNVFDTLRRASACAEKMGVIVGFESVLPAQKLCQLCEEISSPAFGIYYDTQNPVTYTGAHVPAEIRLLGASRICQVHVKDGVNSVQGCVHLGCGETSFYETAAALREVGYDAWIVLENNYSRPGFVSPYEDPWDRLAYDVEIAKKAFVLT